jgi:hypothetical protein
MIIYYIYFDITLLLIPENIKQHSSLLYYPLFYKKQIIN